jgi:hypothetical protein
MTLSFTDFIIYDLKYVQEPDGSYRLDNGRLIERNMNDVLDTVMDGLKQIYTKIVTGCNLNPGRIMCNEYVLAQVLTKYSRDVFGESRLQAKIEDMKRLGRITESQKENLSTFTDYGFKIDSCSPYIHRHISNLLYWLCLLKPFSLYPKDNDTAKNMGEILEFHNEYISYLFVMSVLKALNCTITIHQEKRDFFLDFLYDLHYRNISRSALEFYLHKYIFPINVSINGVG